MRGTLRPERVKGKNMKKYSKIARIAAFALAVVMLFAFAGCSGKKNNNNKNNGSGNNNGGSGENRTLQHARSCAFNKNSSDER